MNNWLEKVLAFVKDPKRAYLWITAKGLTKWIPDQVHLEIRYRISIGKPLNLNEPRSFNEKLQWLKLHDRNPLYVRLVDKIGVKSWVIERIGDRFVVPTIAVWDSVDEIEIEKLPDKFVLKTNHDCGGVVVCDDRGTFDPEVARRKLQKHLSTNYFWGTREWPYRDVVPKVFAEKYIDHDRSCDLIDYKFMCFGGQVGCIFTCSGRSEDDLRVDFFDLEWNHLPFERHYRNSDEAIDRPKSLSQMKSAAERLSEGIPFVRVDFYEVDGTPIFGEMTFYPGGGFEEFTPEIWDMRLGDMLELPEAVS